MKYLLTLIIITTLLYSNEELSFEDDFLQSLEEVSEIATKTKLNIDDSPSFVTVLQSNKLHKLGIDNVFEALGLVPGVQLKREKSGVPVVVFRGISQKGEVKLMVDGVTINNTYRGSIYHYLDFPIEMIDRIEVIRGAGSVLYGSGAISGVINIITKSANKESKNSVFVSGGTYSNYKGGAIVSSKVGNFKVALDAYYQKHDKMINSTDRHLKDYSVGLNISDGRFGLIARLKKTELGNSYGVFGEPDKQNDKYQNTNGALFAQLSYNESLQNDTTLEVLTGFSKYGQNVEAGYPLPSVDAINAKYLEDSYFGEFNLISSYIEGNELLIGTKYESSTTLESELRSGSTQLTPISNPNFSREVTSAYINDKYSITRDFDISAGLRYDNYSDFGSAFSPTVSLVYRMNERLRLKALYAHAFRAPSWIELTSNADLKAEKSNSYEFGTVYKGNQRNTLRLNVYKTRLNDMITKNSSGDYIQNSYANFLGTELEYVYTPTNNLEIDLLASFVEAKDNEGEDLSDVANFLITTSLIYELENGLSFGSLLKYVSVSKRSDTDTTMPQRDNMPSSFIFDQTLSYSFKEYSLSFILKDLFDKGTYYALPQNAEGIDFDDGGRSFLLKAQMEF